MVDVFCYSMLMTIIMLEDEIYVVLPPCLRRVFTFSFHEEFWVVLKVSGYVEGQILYHFSSTKGNFGSVCGLKQP